MQLINNETEKKLKILEKQSEFCKLFTNPHRLQILNVLMEEIPSFGEDTEQVRKTRRELTVTQIHEYIMKEFNVEISQTTLSQNLSLLRKNGAVMTRRDGNNIYYKILNPKLMIACGIVREIVIDRLKREQSLIPEQG